MTRIYALAEVNGAIRYIGKADDPERRFKFHMNEVKYRSTTHKLAWLRKLLREDLRPGLLIIEECEEAVWEERERYWIAEYRRRGANLTNATDGGDGQTRITPEMRTRMVAGLRETSVRDQIRETLQAKYPSNKPKPKRRHKPETIEKMRAKRLSNPIVGDKTKLRRAALKQWAARGDK